VLCDAVLIVGQTRVDARAFILRTAKKRPVSSGLEDMRSESVFLCGSQSVLCAERSRLVDIAATAIRRHSNLLKLTAKLVADIDHIKLFRAVSNKADESYLKAKRAWDAYTRHITENGCAPGSEGS